MIVRRKQTPTRTVARFCDAHTDTNTPDNTHNNAYDEQKGSELLWTLPKVMS